MCVTECEHGCVRACVNASVCACECVCVCGGGGVDTYAYVDTGSVRRVGNAVRHVTYHIIRPVLFECFLYSFLSLTHVYSQRESMH